MSRLTPDSHGIVLFYSEVLLAYYLKLKLKSTYGAIGNTRAGEAQECRSILGTHGAQQQVSARVLEQIYKRRDPRTDPRWEAVQSDLGLGRLPDLRQTPKQAGTRAEAEQVS